MEDTMSRHNELANRANQMNPNNDEYWHSRGYDERPDDWEERAREDHRKAEAGKTAKK